MTVVIVKDEGTGRHARNGRERLIRGALDLLGERGFAQADLRQAATRGDAPRGSIYHHFPGGKTDLLQTAVQQRAARLTELLEQALSEQGVLSTIALFARALAGPEDRDPSQIGCVFAALALSPPEESELHATAASAFADLERLLVEALRREGVASTQAPDIAALIVAAAEGALIRARAHESRASITEPLAGLETLLRSHLGRSAIQSR